MLQLNKDISMDILLQKSDNGPIFQVRIALGSVGWLFFGLLSLCLKIFKCFIKSSGTP